MARTGARIVVACEVDGASESLTRELKGGGFDVVEAHDLVERLETPQRIDDLDAQLIVVCSPDVLAHLIALRECAPTCPKSGFPTPIIAMAPNPASDYQIRACSRGALRAFTYPLMPGELVGCVSSILANRDAFAGTRALVVHDSETVREHIASALRDLGVEIVTAGDGADAWRPLQDGSFGRLDLLVTDLALREMRGDELCRRVRHSEHYADVPVVIITSDSRAEVQVRVFECGASDSIVSPIVRPVFLARVSLQLESCILRRQLSVLVDRKTAELRQSMRRLEDAGRAKTEFLANMSHEIRTPLNGIVGFADLLLGSDLRQQQREQLETIKGCSDTLLWLINDILDLAKIESGNVELEVAPFDVRDMAYEAMSVCIPRAAGKGVALLVDIDEIHSPVLGDLARVRQVVANLLSNAMKFTHAGQVLLGVRTVVAGAKGQVLEFRVADTGVGISKDNLTKIFEPFRQADGSTTRRYGGTGLGLAICRRLTALMGGSMRVESEPGRGTTFYFTVRLTRDLDIELPAQPTAHPAVAGRACLVVERNEEAAAILARHVAALGMTPVVCHSMVGALKAADHRPALALVSLLIPHPEHLQLPTRWRSELGVQAPRFVAVVSNKRRETAMAMLRAGFDGTLCQPVRCGALSTTIHQLFDADEQRVTTEFVNPDSVEEGSTFSCSVLVAEDNKVNQMLMKGMLERMGHQPTLVADGVQAVDALSHGEFDMVLMDMQMPNMDGLEATRVIRASGNRIPIVALTANAFESDRKACLRAGMNDFITKPVKRERVHRCLVDLCSSTKLPEESIEPVRVLLVDDDANGLLGLQRMLERRFPRWSFRSASDGMSACTMLGSFMPQLVITDLRMPNMDGCSLVRFIRDSERYRDTRVIVMTGLDETEDDVARVRDAGVDGIAFKPCHAMELFELVVTVLDPVTVGSDPLDTRNLPRPAAL